MIIIFKYNDRLWLCVFGCWVSGQLSGHTDTCIHDILVNVSEPTEYRERWIENKNWLQAKASNNSFTYFIHIVGRFNFYFTYGIGLPYVRHTKSWILVLGWVICVSWLVGMSMKHYFVSWNSTKLSNHSLESFMHTHKIISATLFIYSKEKGGFPKSVSSIQDSKSHMTTNC